ncbi:MAG TPA: ABC transporter ATP-binding protein [Ramlibacter sp.]|nr:ABC transporter ATP-binding protein [Ramlibacter sp.]
MAAVSLLALRGVRFSFPGWPPTVDGVDLALEAGDFHCLVGRSGCGKTTLLKLAAGLLRPQAGEVTFQPGSSAGPGPGIGFVFQSPNLLEWRRVIDNVLLPVALHRRTTAQDEAHAHRLLGQLGLAAHAHKYPRQLSGGQQSRVALARALVLQPALLLLDEPFAALDAITREELQRDLSTLCRQHRTGVLFVTHDIAEAVFLADRIHVVEAGRVVQDFPVALARPRHRAGADFAEHAERVRAALHLEGAAA